MKEDTKNISNTEQPANVKEGRGFLNRQLTKLKSGEISCPFCREKFKGIAALGAHLKQHCT